jgi:hypothetical protein
LDGPPVPNGKVVIPVVIGDNCATLPPEDFALSPKQMFSFKDRSVPGQSIEFEPISEPWTQYKLADGTQVKIKTVLLQTARLDEYNDNGDPFYQFQFQQIVATVVPEELKQKKQ